MASDGQSWQDGKSLAECNKYMLTNSVSTDVTFIVGETKKQVLAHKYVLGSRSSVFYAMLFGPMAESNAAITIPDIEPDNFQEILRYIYYEEVTVTNKNVTSLMFAADKYNIIGVMNRCADYLTSGITVKTVCNVLDIALTLQNSELQSKCLKFVFDNSEAVLQSSSFCDLQRESIRLIIQSDEMAASEKLIYEAVKKWAESQCRENNIDVCDSNIREMIGNMTSLIRFTTMDKNYFAKTVSIGNILTAEEKVQVFHVHLGVNPKAEHLFCNTDPRKSNEHVCMRSSTFSEYWSYTGTPDRINFLVSDKIQVLGFVLCAAREQTSYKIDARLCLNESTLATVSTTCLTTKGDKTFRVMFQSGVNVDPNVRYTVEVKMIGENSMKCINCNRNIINNDVTFTFDTTNLQNNGTNVNKGQIPGIVFRKVR